MGLGKPYTVKKKRNLMTELLLGVGEGAKSYFEADMQKKIMEAQLLDQKADIKYKEGLLGFKEKELASIVEGRKATQKYQMGMLGLAERKATIGEEQFEDTLALEKRKVTSLEESRLATTKLAEVAQRQGVATKIMDNLAKIKEAEAKVQAATTAHERDIAMAKLNSELDTAKKKVAPGKAKESLLDRMFKKAEQIAKLQQMDQTFKLGEQTLDLNQRKFDLDKQASILQSERFDYQKSQDWRKEFLELVKFDLGREDLANLKEYDFKVRQYFERPAADPYVKMQIESNMKAIDLYDWLGYQGDQNAIKVAGDRRKELAGLFKTAGYEYKPGTIEYKKKFLRKDEVITTPAELTVPTVQPRTEPTLDLGGSLMDMVSPAEEAPTMDIPTNPMDLGTNIKESADAVGLDLPLIMAMMKAESTFKPDAKSSAGAVGLLQLMPKTAESLGLSANERVDPMKNITAGIAYLEQLKGRFPTEEQMLAAYNAGPSKAKSPPKETKDYISKVQGYAEAYRADVNLLYKDLQTLHGNISGTPGEPTELPAKQNVLSRTPQAYTPGSIAQVRAADQAPTYTVEWAIGTARRAGKNRLTKTDVELLKAKGFSDEDIEEIKDGIK